MFDRIAGNFFFSCLLCLSLPLFYGCAKKGETQSPGGPGAPGGASKQEVIVDSVGQEDVQIYIYTEGRTTPSKEVEIRTRVSGYLEQLFFEPGTIVQEGDRLALVEQDSYKIALDSAKAELANSIAQASLAESNFARTKILFEKSASTTEELQTQQASLDVARAAIDRSDAAIRNAELNLQYTDLRAPISGKTTKNLVDIGNFVSPTGSQAVLLSISQLDPMFVEFKLSDRQFSELKDRIGLREAFNESISTEGHSAEDSPSHSLALTGMPVDISLMTGVNVFNFDFNIPGKVVALVDNQINFATASITIRAEVKNPLLTVNNTEDYLIYGGQVCRVRIPYEVVPNAILIREGAILTDLDTKYVLVVTKGMFQPKDAFGNPLLDENKKEIPPRETDIVERRDIKLGRLLDTQMRIVLGGLNPGESYIVHGVQRVRIGMEVSPTTLEDYDARRAAETKGQ